MEDIIYSVLVLVAAATLTSSCSLPGNWYDSTSVPTNQMVFRIENASNSGPELALFAVTANVPWAFGTIEYDSSTDQASLSLLSGNTYKGIVTSDCSNITWIGNGTWIKVPYIDHVHVVFMNHLDVGYADFVSNIINEYFTNYFPLALRLAAETKLSRNNISFIYTTHAWLVDLYLNCPPNLIFNDIPVQCPTESELNIFDNAIRKGFIVWHAGPMNMQIELMNKPVLESGLLIAKKLNDKYNRKTFVLSQRDVPGMTLCALPTLTKYNITAVSVGVNAGSAPPAVPKIFNWKSNSASVIALWHAGGYPNNPGPNIDGARGISLRDCTIAPNTTHAICFAFRNDNSGPPVSLEEIDRYFEILKEEFPYAEVFASTIDNFISNVQVNALPVVDKEIGDTWIQGIASDPLKVAQYRAAALGLSECIADNQCDLHDPVVANSTRFLVKLTEHTWGLSGIKDYENWENSQFSHVRFTQSEYIKNEQSWFEQRTFINLTLEASQGHKLNEYITNNIKQLTPVYHDLSEYMEIDPYKQITFGNSNITIGFNSTTGTVNNLMYNISDSQILVLAGPSNQIGKFIYHTYNDDDYSKMRKYYDYSFNAGYDKEGSDYAVPQSKIWPTKLVALYQSKDYENVFLTHSVMNDSKAFTYYGAPQEIWIKTEVKNNFQGMLQVDFELTIVNKTATRLPESTMFAFSPSPPTNSTKWIGTLGKVDGSTINVGSVVNNGSQYQHAVEYVRLYPSNDKYIKQYNIYINSTDVPLVCPDIGDGWTPTPFPAPLKSLTNDYVNGISFNIHNNIWNTNYPLYYPFLPSDKDFKARFSMYLSF